MELPLPSLPNPMHLTTKSTKKYREEIEVQYRTNGRKKQVIVWFEGRDVATA
jgi:hypothetical protein